MPMTMQATFAEVRNHAKQYLDIVASGKPVADIVPVLAEIPSSKRRMAQPLILDGVSVRRMILEGRQTGL